MSVDSKKSKRLKTFRIVGIAEGMSFLLLLFIAMPLKYVWDWPLAVKYVGWAHGILFVAYIYVVFPAARIMKWSFSKTFFALVASLLPFGPFIFDRNMTQEEKEYSKA
ncbi:MAG: DUF3817 domain-containing protein [Nitritalea sp.]